MKNLTTIILVLVLTGFSCKKEENPPNDQWQAIQNIVKTDWDNYKANNNFTKGGLAIKIITQGQYHQYSFDELVGVVATNQIYYFEPDQGYHYSNTGYSILGKIIERVSNKSYSDFIHDELLVSNGLTNTHSVFESTEQGLPEPFVEGYLLFQGVFEEKYLDNMSKNVAEGNIISTTEDLANWVWKLFHGEAGPSQQSVQMMMTCKPAGLFYEYGLGISHVENVGYGHDGGHISYLSKAYYDPDKDIALVMFTNLMNADNLYDEIEVLSDILVKVKKEL